MPTQVIFMPLAEETYHYLKENANSKIERTILRAIDRKIELIKSSVRESYCKDIDS